MTRKKNSLSKKLETGNSKTIKESENISLDTIRKIINDKIFPIGPSKIAYAVQYKNKIIDLPGHPFQEKEEALDALKWLIDYEIWIKYYSIYDKNRDPEKGAFELDKDLDKKIQSIINEDFKIIRITEETKVI